MTTTRRRGAELERALLDAISAEVDERGFAGITFEGVAARAGTSKPVLYRRWPTKAQMVLAAFTETVRTRLATLSALPGTGALRTDITALLSTLRTLITADNRRILLWVIAELETDAAAPLLTLILERTEDVVAPILARAVARGELGPHPIPVKVLGLPITLARHDLVVRGELSDEQIATQVDEITVPLWRAYSQGIVTGSEPTSSGSEPTP
ncbi:TetR/AcrR family transcriptional regulator [Gordonia sp. ABSL1-1]|uniref:TetR/AcrR family transcriptional regulator n=1 Tax=Gordonia sp. ABSL1-1 TaxID=3053923 RepID=UPI0025728D5E|nr:TetR/AcrR family transcriptional regulator [Gordonia sp. ABSL1-1]MDL9936098.1 TetR/AcrR family transcriptional regulator [Gordonia sp. ABSL1-1]